MQPAHALGAGVFGETYNLGRPPINKVLDAGTVYALNCMPCTVCLVLYASYCLMLRLQHTTLAAHSNCTTTLDGTINATAPATRSPNCANRTRFSLFVLQGEAPTCRTKATAATASQASRVSCTTWLLPEMRQDWSTSCAPRWTCWRGGRGVGCE